MNILIFGNTSATNALAWKLVNSNFVQEVIVAPGNGGTAFFAPSVAMPADDLAAITSFVLAEGIDLVIPDAVGIAAGVADEVGSLPLPVFGAQRQLHRIQSSRCAAREWLQHHRLPTPRGRVCTSQSQAEKYAATLAHPLVVVADAPDGPVVVCPDRTSIPRAVAECLEGNTSGAVLIEELINGPRVTASLLTDGATVLPVPATRLYSHSAQPYAPANGAHSAATAVWNKLETVLTQQIREPLRVALHREGTAANGWISTTCIAGPRGPLVQAIELVPCGLEAVAVLLRLESDLLPLLVGCARRTLASVEPPRWRSDAVVAVALQAVHGATDSPEAVVGELDSGVLIFHHATEPALPNPYIPQAARISTTRLPRLGSGSFSGYAPSHTADEPLVAIIAAADPDLATARERVYANLRRSRRATYVYRDDVGAREF